MEDQKLIEDLLNKNTRRKAFEELVRKYSEQLYWQVRKIVISHEDANDVVQEVFIKIWNNLDSFRGDSKITTWIYRIAMNESITFINKERSKYNVSIDDSEFLATKLESDSYFDGDKAQLKLQKAILTLPDKQRIVFNLKYFEEMKYEEMSKVLNTSVGALKASYHHAVKKVEEYLLTEH